MKLSKPMGKKGFIVEGVFVIIILFIFAFAVFVGMKIVNDFNADLPAGLSTEAQEIAQEGADSYKVFNSMFAFVFIGLLILVAVSVFFIPSHPIFFILSFIGLGVVLLFAVIFSNIFEQGVTQTQLHNETLTIPTTVFQNFPLIMLVFSAIIIIILFAKARSGEAV